MNLPLVSVGLVAYNREKKIGRAIESVLIQDHPNIELVISNDCSTDNTHQICLDYVNKDKRIRYYNQNRNLGMTQNFVFVQKEAKGEFFMWLSDDDWLEKDYVSKCLNALNENKEFSLVCGKTRFYQNDVLLDKEDVLSFTNSNPKERVLNYYNAVKSNVVLYGLMPIEIIKTVDYKNTFGADLLLSAQVIFMGKVKTLENTFFNYSEGGISNSSEKLAQYYGFTKRQSRFPYRVLVKEAFWDILLYSKVYHGISFPLRIVFAFKAAFILRERFAQFKMETLLRSKLKIRTRLKNVIRV